MNITKWLHESAQVGYKSLTDGVGMAGAGIGYVTEMVGSLRLFGFTAAAPKLAEFDERHYFLVPDKRAADGYSLVVTRCLPEGVPPINDLPKRRTLHLADERAEAMLRTLLIKQAQTDELAKPAEGTSLADRLRDLVNHIDAIDSRAFHGVLFIGGLVALFNPAVALAIFASTFLPSLGSMLSKYGLRVAQESLTQAEVNRKLKQAEKDVLNQFKSSETNQNINPLLTITDRALRTSEDEFDPLLALHDLLAHSCEPEERRVLKLTSRAVLNVYDKAMRSTSEQAKANLGPEDMRFLKTLAAIEN